MQVPLAPHTDVPISLLSSTPTWAVKEATWFLDSFFQQVSVLQFHYSEWKNHEQIII